MTQPTIPEAERVVAALFVEPGGVYYGLEGVNPWDEKRDARLYRGPHPVVAHPPCARWGRFWSGGTQPGAARRHLGDDGGCFAAALWSVRTFGGVLEHPRDSRAWVWFGLSAPPADGGWVPADRFGGWTCCIEQGHYGHRARKPTWLYAVGVDVVPAGPHRFTWGPAREVRSVQDMARPERARTPGPFRDLLIALARGAA